MHSQPEWQIGRQRLALRRSRLRYIDSCGAGIAGEQRHTPKKAGLIPGELASSWPGRATAAEPQAEPHREPLAPSGMRAVLALVALAAIGAVHAAAPSRCRPQALTRVLIKLKPSMLSCAIDAHVFGGKDFHCSSRCAKDMEESLRTNDAEVACIGERGRLGAAHCTPAATLAGALGKPEPPSLACSHAPPATALPASAAEFTTPPPCPCLPQRGCSRGLSP